MHSTFSADTPPDFPFDMFTTLTFTSNVHHGRLCFWKPRKQTTFWSGKDKDFDGKPEDEGFLEGGGSPVQPRLRFGSPSVIHEEPRFVDGGRRSAANPWNSKIRRTPVVANDDALTRPHAREDDMDVPLKTLVLKLEDEAKKTRQVLRILSEATGMPIIQENGQRRYGPPLDSTTPPPRGSEVFVGKIPRDALEPELVPVFSKAGRIYELRLMMDFSGTNRGYCFVQYYTPEEADEAVKSLNHFEIRKGRLIGVSKSVDNCRLFVGNIPHDKNKEEIFREITQITEGVVNVIVYSNPDYPRKNRGYAFIEYESHKAAAMARRKMIPGNIQLFGSDVAVDWAEPENESKRGAWGRQNNIRIRQPKPMRLPTAPKPWNRNSNSTQMNSPAVVGGYMSPNDAHFHLNQSSECNYNSTMNSPGMRNGYMLPNDAHFQLNQSSERNYNSTSMNSPAMRGGHMSPNGPHFQFNQSSERNYNSTSMNSPAMGGGYLAPSDAHFQFNHSSERNYNSTSMNSPAMGGGYLAPSDAHFQFNHSSERNYNSTSMNSPAMRGGYLSPNAAHFQLNHAVSSQRNYTRFGYPRAY